MKPLTYSMVNRESTQEQRRKQCKIVNKNCSELYESLQNNGCIDKNEANAHDNGK